MKRINLIGHRYNRLTVIEEAPNVRNRSAWKCRCDCGNECVVNTYNLRGGDTKSCGCLNIEKMRSRSFDMYIKNKKYSPVEATARKIWRSNYVEMDFNDFFELSQNDCFYCKAKPSNIQNAADKKSSIKMKTDGYFIYNGLDRIDNSNPHSKENCVPCCKYCNYAKRERSIEDFKNWIIQIHNNFIK